MRDPNGEVLTGPANAALHFLEWKGVEPDIGLAVPLPLAIPPSAPLRVALSSAGTPYRPFCQNDPPNTKLFISTSVKGMTRYSARQIMPVQVFAADESMPL